MSINHLPEKDKPGNNFINKMGDFMTSEKGKDIYIILIIIFVAFASFGLGRLSNSSYLNKEPIEIENPSDYNDNKQASVILAQKSLKNTLNNEKDTKIAKNSVPASKGQFLASKRGKKYYPVNCSGAKQIIEENRIYFENEEKAINAGYEKSNSCK